MLDAQQRAEDTRDGRAGVPSVLIALLVASLAAAAFVIHGYLEWRHAPTCDGGTCGVAFLQGIVFGAGAWVIGFPLTWILTASIRRLVRRRSGK